MPDGILFLSGLLPYFTLSKHYHITFVLAYFYGPYLMLSFMLSFDVIKFCYRSPLFIFLLKTWHIPHFFYSNFRHFTFRNVHHCFLCFLLLLIFWETSSVFSDWYEWWGEWRKCRKCDEYFVTKNHKRLSMNVRFVPRTLAIRSQNN